jgi:hypothetical protein
VDQINSLLAVGAKLAHLDLLSIQQELDANLLYLQLQVQIAHQINSLLWVGAKLAKRDMLSMQQEMDACHLLLNLQLQVQTVDQIKSETSLPNNVLHALLVQWLINHRIYAPDNDADLICF